MSDQRNGGIAWTDETWNPTRGCSRISDGCTRCYAERVAARFSGPGQPYEGLAEMTPSGPRWTGKVQLIEERLLDPIRWQKPRRIFVASMSDPNHDSVPDDFRDRMLAVIAVTPQHSYQWLTKRVANMRAYFSDPQLPFRVQRAIDAIAVDEAMRGLAEEWRSIDDYVGHYEVSNYGVVRSKTERPLQPRAHPNGYAAVSLSKNAVVSERLIHRLVLTAFVGPPTDGDEVAHRNGNRSDNRIANLSWGSRADNMADASRHGTAGTWMKGRATLTADQVAEIRQRRARGERLDDIAAAVGSNRQQVSAVALGRIFKPAALTWPLSNLWLGVSVEDQATADERIPLLLQTPAAIRFVSYEPALGPVDFGRWLTVTAQRDRMLDWLIVGGESGPGARPFDLAWARSAIKQCRAVGVACFVKQLGAKPQTHCGQCGTDVGWGVSGGFIDACGPTHVQLIGEMMAVRDHKGDDMSEWPDDLRVREFPHE